LPARFACGSPRPDEQGVRAKLELIRVFEVARVGPSSSTPAGYQNAARTGHPSRLVLESARACPSAICLLRTEPGCRSTTEVPSGGARRCALSLSTTSSARGGTVLDGRLDAARQPFDARPSPYPDVPSGMTSALTSAVVAGFFFGHRFFFARPESASATRSSSSTTSRSLEGSLPFGRRTSRRTEFDPAAAGRDRPRDRASPGFSVLSRSFLRAVCDDEPKRGNTGSHTAVLRGALEVGRRETTSDECPHT